LILFISVRGIDRLLTCLPTYLLPCLCLSACLAGFFIKSNQAQSTWKRRFFVARAGLLVFFKDDPSRQPPGVATIPQGAVPLRGCHVALPEDFRRSFAWKPRKGVTGFELKLGHRCACPPLPPSLGAHPACD
jgi:hypothetical protein